MFQINVDALTPPEAFPYLDRTIAYNNSDWSEVCQNLRKVRRRWGVIAIKLVKKRASMWAQGMIYKTVDQSVLLYKREIWVVMGEMLKVLEEFHHRATRRITGMTDTRGGQAGSGNTPRWWWQWTLQYFILLESTSGSGRQP